MHNVIGQQINRVIKTVIQLYKDIDFSIDIKTNLKIVSFPQHNVQFKQWYIQTLLKAHRQILKNGASKSIFYVIKHANFQLYRVHPD